jgi:prepilin-type N-terminal cleavage/methylation domain-containing protein
MGGTEHRQGFTLIELSIVLVIIGLIVGGILLGQTLISAAAVRAQISQIEKYQTAVATFREKYGYLPGDIPAGPAAQFGFAARGTYAGEGDGNGVIEGIETNASGSNNGTFEGAGETVMFWVDLSAAHLIDGTFNTASATSGLGKALTATSSPSISAFLPTAKIDNNQGYVYVYSYNGANYFGLAPVYILYSYSGDGYVTASSNNSGSLTPQQAYAIDTKIDDGMPLTGNVTAVYVACCSASDLPGSNDVTYAGNGSAASASNPMWSGACFDNRSTPGVQPTYSLLENGGQNVQCELSFKFMTGD